MMNILILSIGTIGKVFVLILSVLFISVSLYQYYFNKMRIACFYHLQEDYWQLQLNNGQCVQARLQPTSVVSANFMILQWRTEHNFFGLLLLPDSESKTKLHQLRVQLFVEL